MLPARQLAVIISATQDHAAGFNEPPFKFDTVDIADLITRLYLAGVADRYGYPLVTQTVRDHLAAHPELLRRPRAERDICLRLRTEVARARLISAAIAAHAGDRFRAERLFAGAREIDPLYVSLHPVHGVAFPDQLTTGAV